MKDIILVDNSIISFAFQMNNGIPIKAYMRQENDEELHSGSFTKFRPFLIVL